MLEDVKHRDGPETVRPQRRGQKVSFEYRHTVHSPANSSSLQ